MRFAAILLVFIHAICVIASPVIQYETKLVTYFTTIAYFTTVSVRVLETPTPSSKIEPTTAFPIVSSNHSKNVTLENDETLTNFSTSREFTNIGFTTIPVESSLLPENSFEADSQTINSAEFEDSMVTTTSTFPSSTFKPDSSIITGSVEPESTEEGTIFQTLFQTTTETDTISATTITSTEFVQNTDKGSALKSENEFSSVIPSLESNLDISTFEGVIPTDSRTSEVTDSMAEFDLYTEEPVFETYSSTNFYTLWSSKNATTHQDDYTSEHFPMVTSQVERENSVSTQIDPSDGSFTEFDGVSSTDSYSYSSSTEIILTSLPTGTENVNSTDYMVTSPTSDTESESFTEIQVSRTSGPSESLASDLPEDPFLNSIKEIETSEDNETASSMETTVAFFSNFPSHTISNDTELVVSTLSESSAYSEVKFGDMTDPFELISSLPVFSVTGSSDGVIYPTETFQDEDFSATITEDFATSLSFGEEYSDDSLSSTSDDTSSDYQSLSPIDEVSEESTNSETSQFTETYEFISGFSWDSLTTMPTRNATWGHTSERFVLGSELAKTDDIDSQTGVYENFPEVSSESFEWDLVSVPTESRGEPEGDAGFFYTEELEMIKTPMYSFPISTEIPRTDPERNVSETGKSFSSNSSITVTSMAFETSVSSDLSSNSLEISDPSVSSGQKIDEESSTSFGTELTPSMALSTLASVNLSGVTGESQYSSSSLSKRASMVHPEISHESSTESSMTMSKSTYEKSSSASDSKVSTTAQISSAVLLSKSSSTSEIPETSSKVLQTTTASSKVSDPPSLNENHLDYPQYPHPDQHYYPSYDFPHHPPPSFPHYRPPHLPPYPPHYPHEIYPGRPPRFPHYPPHFHPSYPPHIPPHRPDRPDHFRPGRPHYDRPERPHQYPPFQHHYDGHPTYHERPPSIPPYPTQPRPPQKLIYSGDATFFYPSVGACGTYNSASDLVVAVGHRIFDKYTPGRNPNDNTKCGMKLVVNYKGRSVEVTVADRLGGGGPADLSLSPAAFEQLADTRRGKIRVTWYWAEENET